MGFYPPDENLKYLAELDAVLADNAPVASTPDGLGEPLPVTDSRGPKVADVVGTEEPAYDQTPPEPEAPVAAAPAQTPPVAPAAQPAPIRQPAPVVAQTQGEQSKLVQTKPNWYDDLAPPDNTGGKIAAGLFGSLLGMAATPSGRGRRGRREANEQRIAGLLGGVGNAVAAGVNAPMENYQNRLNAAGKQADMHAKLNSGSGDALGWERLRLSEQKRLDAIKNAEEKARAKAELDDVNSPRSKSLWNAAVQGGVFKPDDKPLSGTQLLFIKPQAGQAASQERGVGNAIHLGNIREGRQVEREGRANEEHDRRFEMDQTGKIASEERDQQKLDEQAYIPGFKYAGKRAPNIASVEAARKIADATETAQMSANRMVQLWQELSTKARLTPAWLEGALSDEDRSKVNELRSWGLNLDTAQRQLANMGVPQQFEMAIVRNISPDATGIRALLNDGQAWSAQARVLQALSDKRMQKYGYEQEATEAPAAAAVPKKPNKPLATKVREAGAATGELADEAIGAGKEVVAGATKTAGKVVNAAADAVAPTAKKIMARVNKGGKWSDPMPVSKKRFDELKAQLGDALEEVAQ